MKIFNFGNELKSAKISSRNERSKNLILIFFLQILIVQHRTLLFSFEAILILEKLKELQIWLHIMLKIKKIHPKIFHDDDICSKMNTFRILSEDATKNCFHKCEIVSN